MAASRPLLLTSATDTLRANWEELCRVAACRCARRRMNASSGRLGGGLCVHVSARMCAHAHVREYMCECAACCDHCAVPWFLLCVVNCAGKGLGADAAWVVHVPCLRTQSGDAQQRAAAHTLCLRTRSGCAQQRAATHTLRLRTQSGRAQQR